jgi:hypothetical protein
LCQECPIRYSRYDQDIGRKLSHIYAPEVDGDEDDGALPPHFVDVSIEYFSLPTLKQIFPFTKNLSDTEITEFKPVML